MQNFVLSINNKPYHFKRLENVLTSRECRRTEQLRTLGSLPHSLNPQYDLSLTGTLERDGCSKLTFQWRPVYYFAHLQDLTL